MRAGEVCPKTLQNVFLTGKSSKREPLAQKGLPPIRIPRSKVSPPLIFDE